MSDDLLMDVGDQSQQQAANDGFFAEGDASAAPASASEFDMEAFRSMQQAPEPAPYVPPVSAAPVSDGPTPLQKFNTERRARLEELSGSETKKRNEALAKGKAELEKFKSERGSNISAAAQRVKEEEKLFVQSLVSHSTNMWELVVKMIDNEQKAGRKDTARMRSVMIQVKNDK